MTVFLCVPENHAVMMDAAGNAPTCAAIGPAILKQANALSASHPVSVSHAVMTAAAANARINAAI